MSRYPFICCLTASALLSSPSMGSPCERFDAANTWDWGLGGGSAWVSYGDKRTKKQVITFTRSPEIEATKIYFHEASKAVRPGQQIPGFVEFSFEAGSGASIVAIDGVAVLEKFPEGQVGMVQGNMNYPDASLRQFAAINRRMRDKFKFYIADTCYEIPLTKAAKVAMRIVFSPQSEFNKMALGLNDVREGRVSLAAFSRR